MQRPMQRAANVAEPHLAGTSGMPHPQPSLRARGTRGQKRGQFRGQAPF